MKKTLLLVFIACAFFQVQAQNKIPLNHSVYDSWKDLSHAVISDDGNYVAYEVNPQQGDGWLYIYDVKNNKLDSVARGKNPVFISNSKLLIFRIKPQFEKVIKMQRKHVKRNKLPKDSLGILYLENGAVQKWGQIQNLQLPKNSGENWIAFTLKKQISKKKSKKEKKKKLKPAKGNKLVLFNVQTKDTIYFNNVTHYTLSKNGLSLALVSVPRDTVDKVKVIQWHNNLKKGFTWLDKNGYSANITLDENGKQIAYTYSGDTLKNKAYSLYYGNEKLKKPINVSGKHFSNLKKGWSVSKYGQIFFNTAGTELYFGTSPKPLQPLKDTLAPQEVVRLDVWTWHDKRLQPQQKVELKRDEHRSYTAVFFPKKNFMKQLGDSTVKRVIIDKKATGKYSIGLNNTPYEKMSSWIGHWFQDIYLIDRTTGERKLILKKQPYVPSLSPAQQSVAWYNIFDSTWNVYRIRSGNNINLTKNISVPFYNVLNDVPNEAPPYGMAGWTKDDKLVVYDRFDLWKLDPAGKKAPVNLTLGKGMKNNLKFRYVKLNKETRILPADILLSAFQIKNKKAGFFRLMKNSAPQKLILADYAFTRPVKAKNSNKLIWRKQSFRLYPDLYLSNLDFRDVKKISEANPQQKNYLWGTVELVSWKTFDGDTMQGLLYKPGNFNPNKKYPTLVYFYERYSDRIHRYYAPRPIRSVINFSYYASNGYVIFVPDIKYKDGYPGPSAYNCIVSGTQSMADRFPFIDRDNLGMQGQSWGGYQSAYLVTQTNMFKCAQAGAPVSNMTSAYGGIRWGSGMSREFQYEHTQSRIGGTLWDKLPLYMLNSPVFFAPRVETPILMMHNDKDNAVPWYQGIEFFNALRRLGKPVWMLVYNGQPHNLNRRADEKDLTRRMQQFFDHYLKGAPEPVWMKYGIPAIDKGRDFGFEYVKPLK